jgi:hypothetical protein
MNEDEMRNLFGSRQKPIAKMPFSRLTSLCVLATTFCVVAGASASELTGPQTLRHRAGGGARALVDQSISPWQSYSDADSLGKERSSQLAQAVTVDSNCKALIQDAPGGGHVLLGIFGSSGPATDGRCGEAGDANVASVVVDSVCSTATRAAHAGLAPGTDGGSFLLQAWGNPSTVNKRGRIAFIARVQGSVRNQGVFAADENGVDAIAIGCGELGGYGDAPTTCGDPAPGGGTFGGFFTGTVFAPDINDAGDVLFFCDVDRINTTRGLFLYRASNGKIEKVAIAGDASPVGGVFESVGPGSLNKNGSVVFLASSSENTISDIFIWKNGAISKVAAVGDPAPGGGTFRLLGTEAFGFVDGTFIPIGPVPDINDNGDICFRAIVSGGTTERGLIRQSDGVNSWLVKRDDPTPAGGTYLDFAAAAMNNVGQIAFFSDYMPTSTTYGVGWFAGAPGNWRKVIVGGDPVDDGQCWGLAYSRNPMRTIDDSGNVLFWTDNNPNGGNERMLIALPDGALKVVARRADPSPYSGTYRTFNPWPSLCEGFGVFGASTPDAGMFAISQHIGFEMCGVEEPNDLPFVDVISAYPGLDDFGSGNSVAWIDYDNDGDLDLSVGAGANNINRLFLNRITENGTVSFDSVDNPLIANPNTTRGLGWGIFNPGDLCPDLYQGAPYTANVMLDNSCGSVVDVTKTVTAGTADETNGIRVVDFDGDGKLDIHELRPHAPDRLLRNLGNWQFQEMPASAISIGEGSFDAAWGDVDGDGDQDVYVTRQASQPNVLLRNDGGGVFTDVTTAPLAITDSSAGASWGDYDNDGDLDLFVTNWLTANHLFRNEGSFNFTDVTGAGMGVERRGQSAVWGDLNNDGWLDLYVANQGDSNQLWLNVPDGQGGRTLEDVTYPAVANLGPSTGVAFADYDQDGDLDIYVGAHLGRNTLLRNEIAPGNHWLEVKLAGTQSNASAIGCRLTVVAGDLTMHREVGANNGMWSQEPTLQHFGLGSCVGPVHLTVRWPSGAVTDTTIAAVDCTVPITERAVAFELPSPWCASSYWAGGNLPVALPCDTTTCRYFGAGQFDVLTREAPYPFGAGNASVVHYEVFGNGAVVVKVPLMSTWHSGIPFVFLQESDRSGCKLEIHRNIDALEVSAWGGSSWYSSNFAIADSSTVWLSIVVTDSDIAAAASANGQDWYILHQMLRSCAGPYTIGFGMGPAYPGSGGYRRFTNVSLVAPDLTLLPPAAPVSESLRRLGLSQNVPNPFNPRTTIKYDLPATGAVRLTVFDVAGRLVRTLVDESMPQGSHEAVWDGRDSSGREVGSGSYLARLEFGGKVETVRMGLIR